jgi:glycosyltransferase involved in cell wall biosynthesis
MFTLAASLRDQGHHPVLVSWSDQLRDAWSSRDLGPVTALPGVPQHDRWKDLQVLGRHRAELPHLDAVVIYSYMLLPAVPLLRTLPQLRGATFSLDLHDQIEGTKGRAILQAGVLGLNSVIAVSQFSTEQTRHWNYHVLHRPIVPAAQAISTFVPGSGPLRVGIIGRLDWTKKHLVAIEAVSRLGDRAELLIRGDAVYVDPAYLRSVEDAVAAADSVVRMEGAVPTAQAFTGVDVVVVCNDREPMGRTVAEAQLRGIPVVVPSAGGASELVEPGVTGLHFKPNDSASLAAQLERLASEPGLAARLGQAGAAAAGPRHDPDSYARDYLNALLPGRGGPVRARTAGRVDADR